MFRALVICLLFLPFCALAQTVTDPSRDREIPIETYFPDNAVNCSPTARCAVAMLSAGYGVSHKDYQFLTKTLNRAGYLVVAVGHELPSDPPLSVEGSLYETRAENWQRGADTLSFIRAHFKTQLPAYNFDKVLLIGHSNGGDISAWLINHGATFADHIITLDHRRVPLPRDPKIKVLSIRASDFPADPGVLPNNEELKKYHSCVVTIAKAKHNDMSDEGPHWLKHSVAQMVTAHLNGSPCQN